MKTLPLLILGALGALLFQAGPPPAAVPTSHDWQESLNATHVPLSKAVATARKQTGGRVVSARLENRPAGEAVQTVYRIQVLAKGHLLTVEVGGAKGGVSRVESGFDFENETAGKIPRGWTAGETHGAGTPGTWRIESFPTAPSGDKVMSLARTSNAGSTFNLLLSDGGYPSNLKVGVSLLARSGHEDRGGGVLWRALDAGNYYVARWNPLENNLRAYKVVDGERTQLAGTGLEADPSRWHRIEAVMSGSHFVIRFDGRQVLSGQDSTFPEGGRAGLWTKADAATRFDDFEVVW